MSRRDDELPMSGEPRIDEDVRREIEFHLEQRVQELRAAGVAADRAMATARELFGDRESIERECRTIEQRRRTGRQRLQMLRAFTQDMRYAFRRLRRTPLFTLSAALVLALGVGANTAVFTVLYHALLAPLPYADADRLITLNERHAGGGWANVPWANFVDLQFGSRSFDALAAYGQWTAPVLGAREAVRVPVTEVSREFFDVFRVRAERGRAPSADEHRVGASPVLVVSHAFWRDQLGAPTSLHGVQLTLDVVYDVIGVMPDGFAFPDANALWIPLERSPQSTSRTAHNWEVIGRLRAGSTSASAERELQDVLGRIAATAGTNFDAVGANVSPLHAALTRDLETPLYLLFSASALLLLAACTNVASAQLARGMARESELAIRSALGAGRGRLVRQLLTESVALAIVGASGGVCVAIALLAAFRRIAPTSLHLDRISMNVPMVVFASVCALLTAALFGLYPALRLSRHSLANGIRQRTGGGGAPGGRQVWSVLVAAEIALAMALLASSSLLIRSFAKVTETDLGFEASNVTTAHVALPSINYPNDSSRAVPRFHTRVLAGAAEGAAGRTVGFVNRLPLGGSNPSGSLIVEGKPLNESGRSNAYAIYRVIGGDYFGAMGIRLLQGRTFRASDDERSSPVVIVDETFAKTEWPGLDPIGRRLKPAGMDAGDEPWHTVIGVVSSVRLGQITDPFQATYYFDHRQRPSYRSADVTYVVRAAPAEMSAGMPAARALRTAINAVDAEVPIESSTLERTVAAAVDDRRFLMLLLANFSAIALALALTGVYGVVSYTVTQRTREIGVRVALGATSRQVIALVFAGAMRGVIPGLMAGLMLAVAAAHTMRSLVYGVSPFDVAGLAITLFVLGFIAVVATMIPARRATRVDPAIAMRGE